MNEVGEKVIEPTHTGKRNSKFDLVALILCLIIALSVWLYVESINQDIVEKEIIVTFDAEKQIFDETGMYIFSGNKDIDYSQVEVKLTVSGSKAVLERYEDDEYVVELDTSGITQAGGRYGVYFKYKLPSDEIQYKSIVATAYTSSLMLVDHKAEREVDLTADYTDAPSKKESIVICTPKSEKISVSGPASMINEINKVVATVSIASLSESTVVKSKNFEFFGEDGSPILLNGSYVSLTPAEVDVNVVIKYINEPISIRVEPKSQDVGEYIYEIVSACYENGDPLTLLFDGDSSYFPKTGEIVWNIGDLSVIGEEKRETVATVINSSDFDSYRNKLSLHIPEDADKVIQIKISKRSKTTENLQPSVPENDDTTQTR